MQIPKKLKVGRTRYAVEQLRTLPRGMLGQTDYDTRTIKIATHSAGKRVAKNEVSDTFWHELTHAILKDMGVPEYSNERFVRRFASRLNNAINSARF